VLTTTQRRDRYAAQAGVPPRRYHLTPAQLRRSRHKTRRHFAAPARLDARAQAQARRAARPARLDAIARAFLGVRAGARP
jgi:hypothetical protein